MDTFSHYRDRIGSVLRGMLPSWSEADVVGSACCTPEQFLPSETTSGSSGASSPASPAEAPDSDEQAGAREDDSPSGGCGSCSG